MQQPKQPTQPIDEISTASTVVGAKILGIAADGQTKLYSVSDIKGDFKGLATPATDPGIPVLAQYYRATPGVTYPLFKNSANEPIAVPLLDGGLTVFDATMIWDNGAWMLSYGKTALPAVDLTAYAKTADSKDKGVFESVDLAIAGVPLANRKLGDTVGIKIGGAITEYWWKSSTDNDRLIKKTIDLKDVENKIIETSPNKFDKTKVTSEGHYNYTFPYNWIVATGVSQSEFFDVKPGGVINFKLTNTSKRHVVFKNEAGVIYTGEYLDVVDGSLSVAIASNSQARKIAIQLYNSELDAVMVTVNEPLPASYEPFKPDALKSGIVVDGVGIKPKSISKEKVGFSTVDDILDLEFKDINLLDKSNIVFGGYYKEGVWVTAEKGIDSYEIKNILNGDVVRIKNTKNISNDRHYVFLNAGRGILWSGRSTPVNGVVTFTISDPKVKSISIMLFHSDIDNVMITINNPIPSEYTPFGGKIVLKENLRYALQNKSAKDPYRAGRLLIWEDDFNAGILDEANWTIGERHNMPSSNIDSRTARPSNVKVQDSNLVITAIREKYRGKDFTSGMVFSAGKKEFKYGRIEAKMKLAGGAGYWPAFWMLGQSARTMPKDRFTMQNFHNGGVPYCGEIDIMEFYGASDRVESRIHAPLATGGGIQSSPIAHSPSIAISAYNIYAAEWTENQIVFLVNDVIVAEVNTSQYAANGRNAFNEPFYIILNFAVRAESVSASTPNEESIYVDWVRVYSPVTEPNYVKATSLNVYKRDVSIDGGGVIYQGVAAAETLVDGVLNLTIGEKLLLAGKNTPANTSSQVMDWKSSNESIVICEGGIVKGMAVGSATITVVNDNYLVKVISVIVQ